MMVQLRNNLTVYAAALLILLLGCLSSCSSPFKKHRSGGYYKDDGPPARAKLDIHNIPDAIPKREPIRAANAKPYKVNGKTYYPRTKVEPYQAQGTASWYGKKFHGQKTASGEVYNMLGMTAAHPILPIPSYVKVTNLHNGRSVTVRVNDRGPFLRGREIDLSYAAAQKLGYAERGSAKVAVEQIIVGEETADSQRKIQANSPTQASPKPPSVLANQPVKKITPATLSRPVYLQLAAFAQLDNATKFAQANLHLVDFTNQQLAIAKQLPLYRVVLGPFTSEAAAQMVATKLIQANLAMPILWRDNEQ